MLCEGEIWCGFAAFGDSETRKGSITQRSIIKPPGYTFHTDVILRYALPADSHDGRTSVDPLNAIIPLPELRAEAREKRARDIII
jgi:hypothetical protein